jgi:uncharacterized protein DUF3999
MNRSAVSATLMLAGVTLAAQTPEAWKNWQYSAPIEAPAGAPAGLVSVILPAAVTAHARPEWQDVRVIDGEGREIPFVLHAREVARSSELRSSRLLEPGIAPGQYSQAIVDTGATGRVHNAVTLGVDGTDDVLTWVEIAAGSDASTWHVIRERAPIYRLTQDGMGTQMRVTYPDSVSRYLRIRVLDTPSPRRIVAADILYEVVTLAERLPAGVPLMAEGSGRQSSWTSAADHAAIPVSQVRFTTSQTPFYRPVRVESSDDGQRWVWAASGEIFRITEAAGGVRESLAVTFPEAASRRWRITVLNRDDAPLADLRPELYAIPRRVVFRYEPGKQYRLVYGHSRVAAPQYDLGQLTDVKTLESAMPAVIGAEVANPAYADPAPWTERNQAVLWVALGIAVLAVGALAVRSLR